MDVERSFQSAVRALGEQGFDALQSVFEGAPFGVYVDDPSLGCTYANAALLEQFGVDWEDFQGFRWATRVLPEDAERLQVAITEFELTRRPIHVTYRILRERAECRWIHARVHAVVAAHGERLGSIGITRDVTDEMHLKSQNAERQKLEAVGTLAARIAHDFNNLLTVLVASRELVEPEVASAEGLANLQAMDLAFSQAQQLTHQLLTLARKPLPGRHTCELDVELERLERLLRGTLGEGVELDVRLGARGCHVPLSVSQLGQVILNLATNGRDAMEGRGRLAVVSARDGDRARVSVVDHGCGMSEEVRARAFEPFYTTKDQGRGTGLGLATLRDLIEAVGGVVELDSVPDRGTCASVWLPRSGAPHADAGDGDAPAEVPRAQGELVLVLEDNEAVRQSTGYALALAGYRVLTVGSLAEARARAEEFVTLDAVVSDVMLPDGQGPEFVGELRASAPGLPVVFTSGFAGDALEPVSSSDDRTAFVSKPYRPRDILVALQRVTTARP